MVKKAKPLSVISQTTPQWLASYPNKGPLDYFGFRFLRQTNREHLFRSAASNNFSNAKPLLFYPAIALEFQQQQGIDREEPLPKEQQEKWLQWYQRAHFLFVTHQTMKFGYGYDAGFTGAKMILDEFRPFIDGQEKTLEIDWLFPKFYGEGRRPWGYLKQFWSGALGFYHAIQNIDRCRVGNYGEEAHQLMSSFEHWRTLVKVLKTGIITRNELDRLEPILTCEGFSQAEKALIQKMILDQDSHHKESALIYEQSFEAFCGLFDDYEILNDSSLVLEVITLFLYRYYRRQPLYNDRENAIRTLCNSYPFELGLVLLFRRLSRESTSSRLSEKKIKSILEKDIDAWLDRRKMSLASFDYVASQYFKLIARSEDDFRTAIYEIYDLKSASDELWIDGILLGYLAYKIDVEDASLHSSEDWYSKMTNEYYAFVPQVIFRDFPVSNAGFKEGLLSLSLHLLRRQYDFAIERIQLGQIAKFLTLPASDIDAIEFEVDEENILPQEGVIGLFQSMVSFWLSAGLLKGRLNHQVRCGV
jgi:hypothetical protein